MAADGQGGEHDGQVGRPQRCQTRFRPRQPHLPIRSLRSTTLCERLHSVLDQLRSHYPVMSLGQEAARIAEMAGGNPSEFCTLIGYGHRAEVPRLQGCRSR